MEHVSALLYTCQHYWTRVTCSLVSSTAGALPGSVAVTSGVLEPGPVSATTTSLSLEYGDTLLPCVAFFALFEALLSTALNTAEGGCPWPGSVDGAVILPHRQAPYLGVVFL